MAIFNFIELMSEPGRGKFQPKTRNKQGHNQHHILSCIGTVSSDPSGSIVALLHMSISGLSPIVLAKQVVECLFNLGLGQLGTSLGEDHVLLLLT